MTWNIETMLLPGCPIPESGHTFRFCEEAIRDSLKRIGIGPLQIPLPHSETASSSGSRPYHGHHRKLPWQRPPGWVSASRAVSDTAVANQQGSFDGCVARRSPRPARSRS